MTIDFSSHNSSATSRGFLPWMPVTGRDPSLKGKLPFRTQIATSREDSVREAALATEEVTVYTDGSAMNGKVGAAAMLTRPGNLPRSLHLHLGTEKEHT